MLPFGVASGCRWKKKRRRRSVGKLEWEQLLGQLKEKKKTAGAAAALGGGAGDGAEGDVEGSWKQ